MKTLLKPSNKLKQNAGFSLIELMVVVAIIGILATIAIPNFQRFQARSRQSSAKTELAAIFTAQKSFFAAYQTYHAHLPLIGFVPEGVDSADLSGQPFATSARVYGSIAHSAADAANIPVDVADLGLTLPTGGFVRGYYALDRLCQAASIQTNLVHADLNITGYVAETEQNTFMAIAAGCPRQNLLTDDRDETDLWSIDHLRQLRNQRSGI